jgi:hypothetical protein
MKAGGDLKSSTTPNHHLVSLPAQGGPKPHESTNPYYSQESD